MKRQCVIYARVSTDIQRTKSQIEDLQRWANTNNYDVIKIFDESMSGFIENRDELINLKSFVKENNIKQILCYELSRLGRSTLQTLKEIDYFSKENVNIFFKKENINSLDKGASNQLLLNILSSIAELEVTTFKERTARGNMSAVLKGKAVFYSVLPYGYTKDEQGMLIINEEEAKTIRMMYDMASKGITLYQIATKLNSLGIPTRFTKMGRKSTFQGKVQTSTIWRPKVIQQILNRTLYKGLRIFKGVSIKVPAIVSESVWDDVQTRFKEHIGNITNTKYDYLFKGKIRCGKCGYAWATYTYKKKNEGYYFCQGLTTFGHKCANGNYISASLVDKYLFVGLFNHPSVSETVLDDTLKESKNEELRKQIIYFKDEIEKAEAKKKRLIKMFTEGYIDENEFNKEQLTIKNNINDFKNKIRLNESELALPEDININELLTSVYRNDDFNIKREFIVKYVNKVMFNYVKPIDIKFERPIHSDDKFLYARVWAFGHPDPLHIVMTSDSKQCNIYVNQDKLKFNDTKNSLSII